MTTYVPSRKDRISIGPLTSVNCQITIVAPIFRDKKPELSLFAQKLNVIVTKLKRQITICRQQIG